MGDHQAIFNYHAIPGNRRSLCAFRSAVARYWRRALARPSQVTKMQWRRMRRLLREYLPTARTLHSYPCVRFDAMHPSEEPYGVIPLVRICARGVGRPASLPRPDSGSMCQRLARAVDSRIKAGFQVSTALTTSCDTRPRALTAPRIPIKAIEARIV